MTITGGLFFFFSIQVGANALDGWHLPLPPGLLGSSKAKASERIEELIAKEGERLLEEDGRIWGIHIRGDGVHICEVRKRN